MRRRATAVALLLAAAAAACGDDGDDGDDGGPETTTTTLTSTTIGGAEAIAASAVSATAAGGAAETTASVPVDGEAAACAEGKTRQDGVLTIATAEPASPPYVINDAPENGQGFEAAVAYAVAATMGFGPEQVRWTRTPFEAAIAPGPKDFDFNIQQFSITPEHQEAVTFSHAYYSGNQAILGYADSPAASARSLSDFQDLRIGVAAGTTSLTFVTDVLQPTEDPQVFNDNAAAKAALDGHQIDAIVADLPTAVLIRDVEIEGTQVFGQFPPVAGAEGEPWGLLFSKDNPLVECANLALAALTDSGLLEGITEQWMTAGTGIPEIPLE
jgi:polar amino acid transport system substrate-binding protein